MGGSLNQKGGHNPLEAALCQVPAVMGDSQYNCADICQALTAASHLDTLTQSHRIADHIITLFNTPTLRRQKGEAGYRLVQSQKVHFKRILICCSKI